MSSFTRKNLRELVKLSANTIIDSDPDLKKLASKGAQEKETAMKKNLKDFIQQLRKEYGDVDALKEGLDQTVTMLTAAVGGDDKEVPENLQKFASDSLVEAKKVAEADAKKLAETAAADKVKAEKDAKDLKDKKASEKPVNPETKASDDPVVPDGKAELEMSAKVQARLKELEDSNVRLTARAEAGDKVAAELKLQNQVDALRQVLREPVIESIEKHVHLAGATKPMGEDPASPTPLTWLTEVLTTAVSAYDLKTVTPKTQDLGKPQPDNLNQSDEAITTLRRTMQRNNESEEDIVAAEARLKLRTAQAAN